MIQIVNMSDRLEANGKVRLWLRSPKASQAVLVAADFLKQSIEVRLMAKCGVVLAEYSCLEVFTMAQKRLSQLDCVFRFCECIYADSRVFD